MNKNKSKITIRVQLQRNASVHRVTFRVATTHSLSLDITRTVDNCTAFENGVETW